MSRPTVLIVGGTRPEIIKLAPIILRAKARNTGRTILCVTGQHRSMAEEALRMFGLTPDEDLGIMRPDQSLNHIGASVLTALPGIIEKHRPSILLVQGDTTTAAYSALTAFQMGVPVAHVEAGLRSYRLDAPFPEEANRRLISVVAKHNFCPTESAREALRREGIEEHTLHVTGNTVVDSLLYLKERNAFDSFQKIHPGLRRPFVLITAHRRESFGSGIEDMCRAFQQCARAFPDVLFVYPVHMNPNVGRPVHEMLSSEQNILLLDPLPYLSMLVLLNHCEFALTDSGGIQEEAPSFGKYCIVMREVTERRESVEAGISELVGTNSGLIVAAVSRRLSRSTARIPSHNPYGDGKAAERIWDVLGTS